jgi:hypothetical protein
MQKNFIESNGNLVAGIHICTWEDIQEVFAFNERRQELLRGLKRACESLKLAGCRLIYIGGSFATDKEFPGDFDFCWESEGVDRAYLKELDPVFFDFSNKRAAQKAKYGGEFFRANTIADAVSGKTYLEFFQEDRNGNPKGIIAVEL